MQQIYKQNNESELIIMQGEGENKKIGRILVRRGASNPFVLKDLAFFSYYKPKSRPSHARCDRFAYRPYTLRL